MSLYLVRRLSVLIASLTYPSSLLSNTPSSGVGIHRRLELSLFLFTVSGFSYNPKKYPKFVSLKFQFKVQDSPPAAYTPILAGEVSKSCPACGGGIPVLGYPCQRLEYLGHTPIPGTGHPPPQRDLELFTGVPRKRTWNQWKYYGVEIR